MQTGMDLLLEELDSSAVSLCFDAGWAAKAGHDPVAFLRLHAARIRTLYLRDFRGANLVALGAGRSTSPPSSRPCPPCPNLHAALVEAGSRHQDAGGRYGGQPALTSKSSSACSCVEWQIGRFVRRRGGAEQLVWWENVSDRRCPQQFGLPALRAGQGGPHAGFGGGQQVNFIRPPGCSRSRRGGTGNAARATWRRGLPRSVPSCASGCRCCYSS